MQIYHFYHLDRSGKLPLGYINLNNDYSNFTKEVADFCKSKFPKGLSHLGINYINNFDHIDHNNPKNSAIFFMEFIFELVRQLEFPNIISRFESMFAVKNLNDAELWLKTLNSYEDDNHSIIQPKICILQCNSYFEADATWRDIFFSGETTTNFALCYYRACKYWSGAKTSNPVTEILVSLPAKVVKRL